MVSQQGKHQLHLICPFLLGKGKSVKIIPISLPADDLFSDHFKRPASLPGGALILSNERQKSLNVSLNYLFKPHDHRRQQTLILQPRTLRLEGNNLPNVK